MFIGLNFGMCTFVHIEKNQQPYARFFLFCVCSCFALCKYFYWNFNDHLVGTRSKIAFVERAPRTIWSNIFSILTANDTENFSNCILIPLALCLLRVITLTVKCLLVTPFNCYGIKFVRMPAFLRSLLGRSLFHVLVVCSLSPMLNEQLTTSNETTTAFAMLFILSFSLTDYWHYNFHSVSLAPVYFSHFTKLLEPQPF